MIHSMQCMFAMYKSAPSLSTRLAPRRDPQAQRVELDETARVFLVVGAGVVFKGCDGRVEQRIGLRVAADDADAALVELEPHAAVDMFLGVGDPRLHAQRC